MPDSLAYYITALRKDLECLFRCQTQAVTVLRMACFIILFTLVKNPGCSLSVMPPIFSGRDPTDSDPVHWQTGTVRLRGLHPRYRRSPALPFNAYTAGPFSRNFILCFMAGMRSSAGT